MSTTNEEKDQIIEGAVESIYGEVVLKGYLTEDELIDRLAELVRAQN